MREACAILLDPRTIIEVAAEFDPDTYVLVLDLLDFDTLELEDTDTEERCDEDSSMLFDEHLHYANEQLHAKSYCPCCGHLTDTEIIVIC